MDARSAVATLLCAACVAPAAPDARAQSREDFAGPARALAPDALDALRGGYVLPSGLVLSFGIERAVFVNDALVASTRVSIPDVRNVTAEQASELTALRDTLQVQIGAGNALSATAGAGVVVQNTLDGQSIRVGTTLDASVGSLGLFQQLNAGAALQSALTGAVGGP